MGQGIHVGAGQSPGLGDPAEVRAQPAERVLLVELAPPLPADDDGGIREHDSLYGRLERNPKPGRRPRPQRGHGVARGAGRLCDGLGRFDRHALEHGVEDGSLFGKW